LKPKEKIPFERKPKQLETIRAAKRCQALNSGVLPTVVELAVMLVQSKSCIYERTKKLEKKKIICVRKIETPERMKLSEQKRKELKQFHG